MPIGYCPMAASILFACNDDPPVVVGPWTDSFVVRLAVGTRIVGHACIPGGRPAYSECLPGTCLTGPSRLTLCGTARRVSDLRLSSMSRVSLYEGQRSLRLYLPIWSPPLGLTRRLWSVSAGLLATRMAELSNSANGSESAPGSSSGGSRPPLAMVQRWFSPFCVSNVF
jgi:hypothetical protein